MPKYNHRYETDDDGNLFEVWTDRSGQDITARQISSDDDDDSGEEGCVACGNPSYPACMASCPLFDD